MRRRPPASVMIDVDMTGCQALVLLAAGMAGGIASTVASVASVVSYPVLLALGLPPLSANVTNTMSPVLTGAGSMLGRLRAGTRLFVPALAAGFLIGGFSGPRLVRRLPVRALRVIVSLCGLALAVKLGAAACR